MEKSNIDKIIILEGSENSGKTTILGMVYRKLKEKGAIDIIPQIKDIKNEEDFYSILKINGKTIGILTIGDPSPSFCYHTIFVTFIRTGVDFIICANRTKINLVNKEIENLFLTRPERKTIDHYKGNCKNLSEKIMERNNKITNEIFSYLKF